MNKTDPAIDIVHAENDTIIIYSGPQGAIGVPGIEVTVSPLQPTGTAAEGALWFVVS